MNGDFTFLINKVVYIDDFVSKDFCDCIREMGAVSNWGRDRTYRKMTGKSPRRGLRLNVFTPTRPERPSIALN